MDTSTSITTKGNDLSKILLEMFLVLGEKEQEVIVKRFSLDNKPRLTLERIGQKFSLTRERIRQIEKIALNKLRRTVKNTKLNLINELALSILQAEGGTLCEDALVNLIIKKIGVQYEANKNIILLALNINNDIVSDEKNNVAYPFWRLKSLPKNSIMKALELAVRVLNEADEVMDVEELIHKIEQGNSGNDEMGCTGKTIRAVLSVDKRIKLLKNEKVGLMSWRHINPKSIRDKAYIILKKNKKPMHFIEIANAISQAAFDKKVVTTQAVHNELIRDEQFVLVGRGLYGLKEDGYKKGTVSDIIKSLLKKKSPLSKQEIINGVLKQRQVKKGTISLNLQKNPQFIRVGRAVYSLEEK